MAQVIQVSKSDGNEKVLAGAMEVGKYFMNKGGKGGGNDKTKKATEAADRRMKSMGAKDYMKLKDEEDEKKMTVNRGY